MKLPVGHKSQHLRGKENITTSELKFNPITKKMQKISGADIRQSVCLPIEKPTLNDITNLTFSLIDQQQQPSIRGSQMLKKSLIIPHAKEVRSHSITSAKSICRSNSFSEDKQSIASGNSHVGSICGGLSSKTAVKQKGFNGTNDIYPKILSGLIQADNKRYFDDLFPPGAASLFYSKGLQQEYKDVRWVRVKEIFPGQKIVLSSQEDRNQVSAGQFKALDYMATCFNLLGTSQQFLERIFERQTYSQFGIYYLRINQGGVWKYLIVDDYIPVRQIGKKLVPLFLSVRPSKTNYYQVWPFILHKALAKIYSSYESLLSDSVSALMQELTGVSPTPLSLNQIEDLSPGCIIVASQPTDKFLTMFPNASQDQFVCRILEIDNTLKVRIQIKCGEDSNPFQLAFSAVNEYFKRAECYQYKDNQFEVGCVIKQQRGNVTASPGVSSGSTSIRKFHVHEFGNCALNLVQKDKKYYHGNGYQYAWMRMVVVMEDIEGLRFIDGCYAQQKMLSISCQLNPGTYYVIIMGDWRKSILQVVLNYQGSVQVEMARQSLSSHPRILEEACQDMALRWGKFKQLKTDIWMYELKNTKLGLFIQHFTNNSKRQVKILSSIKAPATGFYFHGVSNPLEAKRPLCVKPGSAETLVGLAVGNLGPEAWAALGDNISL